MARSGGRRIYLSSQSLSALGFILLGLVMMLTPFVATHSGYIGQVMIARDGLKPPFDKTLILIGQEGLYGSIGIILNKPLPPEQRARLSSFLRDSDLPIGYGGPLGVSDKIFVLKEKKPATSTSEPDYEISTWDNAVRATPDLLDRIRQSLKNGEQRYRIFTGFSGWSSFQLESEALLKKNWYPTTPTHDIIFQNGPAAQWDALEQKKKSSESVPKNQS